MKNQNIAPNPDEMTQAFAPLNEAIQDAGVGDRVRLEADSIVGNKVKDISISTDAGQPHEEIDGVKHAGTEVSMFANIDNADGTHSSGVEYTASEGGDAVNVERTVFDTTRSGVNGQQEISELAGRGVVTKLTGKNAVRASEILANSAAKAIKSGEAEQVSPPKDQVA